MTGPPKESGMLSLSLGCSFLSTVYLLLSEDNTMHLWAERLAVGIPVRSIFKAQHHPQEKSLSPVGLVRPLESNLEKAYNKIRVKRQKKKIISMLGKTLLNSSLENIRL